MSDESMPEKSEFSGDLLSMKRNAFGIYGREEDSYFLLLFSFLSLMGYL